MSIQDRKFRKFERRGQGVLVVVALLAGLVHHCRPLRDMAENRTTSFIFFGVNMSNSQAAAVLSIVCRLEHKTAEAQT